MNRLRWLWLTPVAYLVLRVLGGQLVEQAVDQRDAPGRFASTLLDKAEMFSVGTYLGGLSGLAFLVVCRGVGEGVECCSPSAC